MSIWEEIKNILNNFPLKSSYQINRMRPPGSCDEQMYNFKTSSYFFSSKYNTLAAIIIYHHKSYNINPAK